MTDKEINQDALLETAKQLVVEMESGNTEAVVEIIDELTQVRQTELFQQVGKLTRNVHDSIVEVSSESALSNLSGDALPDARDRLSYVIDMTEESAHKTMEVVEKGMDLIQQSKQRNEKLSDKWDAFVKRELSLEEFKQLSKELKESFELSKQDIEQLNSYLTDILMAQGVQDISGQIIKKVISLVEDVEAQLVNLLEFTSNPSAEKPVKKEEKNTEAAGPALPSDTDRVQNQADVDDLLASLGF